MVKITCTRKLHFCAGHRVMHHEGKCATAHGHNYYIFLMAEAPELDSLGRIIDFAVLKERVGSWIDEHWDHTFLVCEEDEVWIQALRSLPRSKEPYICPFNPTAEGIAKYLLEDICPKLLHGSEVVITKVIVHETENCYAEAKLRHRH